MSKTMNGIDISHYQERISLDKVKYDFIIIKATEGVTIKDASFKVWAKKIAKSGKPWGFYHFAHPENNTAIKEAQEFYKTTKDYYGKGIPVLDWESSGVKNVKWAKEWLDTIYKFTGVKPMIYMSEYVENKYDWSAVAKAGYGLWIAKYRDYNLDRNYDMSRAGNKPSVKHWKTYAMWQWTSSGRLDGYSGNLDCDIFYGDKAAWNKYVGKTHETASKDTTTSKPTETTTKKTYTGTLPTIPEKGYLSKGDKGTQVTRLQQFLNWYADHDKYLKKRSWNPLKLDGIFGANTDKALCDFQKAEGLTIDGKYGKKSAEKARSVKK